MLGSSCSPCCIPVPRCSGISAFNATFTSNSRQQILSRSVVTSIEISPSDRCGGGIGDKWAAVVFSCFILIPENSPALLTLTGQVPDVSSYVFFGVTSTNSTQSGYWVDRAAGLGTYCQGGYVLGDFEFPTFSGQYVERKINMPPQNLKASCSGLTSVEESVEVQQKTDATWYGVTFFKHSNWHGFGIYGYPAHSITATLSW